MHLAAGIWINGKDMRHDKTLKVELFSIKNDKIKKTLRYEG